MIIILSGTNRAQSVTLKIAQQLHGIYERSHANPRILSLESIPPEAFLPTTYRSKPDSVTQFTQPILEASGLVVVTPEYNGGMPGILKYFIDLLPFPESFEHRPVCFVGLAAGMWGALRPVEQLQQIFGYRNAHIYPERVFLPKVNGLLNDEDRITDPDIVGRLEKQATGFIRFISQLKS